MIEDSSTEVLLFFGTVNKSMTNV